MSEETSTVPNSKAVRRAARLAELRSKVVQLGGNPDELIPPEGQAPDETAAEPEDLPPPGGRELPATRVQEGRLASLAHEINTRFNRADRAETQANDHRLAAALNLAEAKRICEEKRINFRAWAEEHIPQAYETVRKLAAVGASDDPAAALADYRKRVQLANAKLRVKRRLEHERNPFSPRPGPVPSIPEAPAPAPDMAAPVEEEEAAAPEASQPTEAVHDAAERGLDEVGLFHAIPMMDEAQRRALADKAAKGLPSQSAREHVKELASVLGLEIVRGDAAKFHPSFDTLTADFDRLDPMSQRAFVEWAASKIGALVEIPELQR